MKKTVNINISGIAFIIDDDAYTKLENYLRTIRGYFSASDGRDEIMGDIEARIAEILSEKTKGEKKVVAMEDINEVIAAMGQPEDYREVKDSGEEQIKQEGEKEAASAQPRVRRLYRDQDSRVLGGVCSGISWYFGIDPIWLRLAFAIAFFVWGSGFLLYLLLWIIIPRAKTTAEKLEMKGESVNISNISKAIVDEMDQVKEKLNEFSEKAKSVDTKPHFRKARDLGDKVTGFVTHLVALLVKTLGRFAGLVMVLFGAILLIALIGAALGKKTMVSITSEGINAISTSDILSTIISSPNYQTVACIGLFIVVGIPILSMLYSGLLLLFRLKNRLKGIGLVFAIIWLCGLVMCGVAALHLANEFTGKGTYKKTVTLMQPQNNVLYIDSSESISEDEEEEEISYDDEITIHRGHEFYLKIDDDSIYLGNTQIDVVRSDNDSFKVELLLSARGSGVKHAVDLAKKINYSFTQSDSLVNFSNFYSISRENQWRNQDVHVKVLVPFGKSVHLNKGASHIIYDIKNVSDTPDDLMIDHTWTMTQNGLVCETCR